MQEQKKNHWNDDCEWIYKAREFSLIKRVERTSESTRRQTNTKVEKRTFLI